LLPYIDAVVEAFGTNRIVFGTDWPVCLVAASYKTIVTNMQQYFTTFSENEQQNFWGNNAIDFYNIQ
jgi:L-fuconolactonase